MRADKQETPRSAVDAWPAKQRYEGPDMTNGKHRSLSEFTTIGAFRAVLRADDTVNLIIKQSSQHGIPAPSKGVHAKMVRREVELKAGKYFSQLEGLVG